MDRKGFHWEIHLLLNFMTKELLNLDFTTDFSMSTSKGRGKRIFFFTGHLLSILIIGAQPLNSEISLSVHGSAIEKDPGSGCASWAESECLARKCHRGNTLRCRQKKQSTYLRHEPESTRNPYGKTGRETYKFFAFSVPGNKGRFSRSFGLLSISGSSARKRPACLPGPFDFITFW